MTGAVSHISSRAVQVIIGVDTHKDQHVAVALDGRGSDLTRSTCPLPPAGMRSSNDGRATWDRFTRSGLRAQVSTAPDSRFLTSRLHRHRGQST